MSSSESSSGSSSGSSGSSSGSSVILKWFCHKCRSGFDGNLSTQFCPECRDYFVERLDNPAEELLWPLNNLEVGVPLEVMRGRAILDLPCFRGSPGRRLGTTRQARVTFDITFENISDQLQGLDSAFEALPLPLPTELIDALPEVAVSEDQIKSKLQCSICWDDFQLAENVRQLPCSHLYHENCIRQWLLIRGTCPVCRKSVDNSQRAQQDRHVTSTTDFNPLQLFGETLEVLLSTYGSNRGSNDNRPPTPNNQEEE